MGYRPPEQPSYQPPYERPRSSRRRGCWGCLIGCGVAIAALVVVVIAGVVVVQRMFPTQESAESAAQCMILRVVVNAAEQWVEQGQGDPEQIAEARRTLAEVRAVYAEECPEASVVR